MGKKQHSLTWVLFLRSKEEFNLKLIIAEKPSVALAIAKALNIKGSRDGYIENGEYIISWCVGHFGSGGVPGGIQRKIFKVELCGFAYHSR